MKNFFAGVGFISTLLVVTFILLFGLPFSCHRARGGEKTFPEFFETQCEKLNSTNDTIKTDSVSTDAVYEMSSMMNNAATMGGGMAAGF